MNTFFYKRMKKCINIIQNILLLCPSCNRLFIQRATEHAAFIPETNLDTLWVWI